MPKMPEGSRPEQDLSAYEGMSDEELDAILKGQKDDPNQPEEDPEDEPEDEDPEEEPAEDDDDDVEPEAEENEDEEDDDPEPEADEDDKLERRLALLERKLEIEGMKRLKAEEDAKRSELLASKQAGRAGYLQQQLKRKPAAKPTEDGEDAEGDWDDDQSPAKGSQDQAASEQAPVWNEDRAEQVFMILRDEGMSFANEHIPEIEQMVKEDNDTSVEDFDKRLQDIIQGEVQRNREDFQSASLKTVRKLARSVMNSAYATARIEYAEKSAEKATVRQAESTGKRIRRKKKAAISKSGKAPKKAAPKAKDYEDMSDEELEAEFKREFGPNYKTGRNTISGK